MKKYYGREFPGHNLQQQKALNNKHSKKMAKFGYAIVIEKYRKSRDKAVMISIIMSVLLLVSIYFNVRWLLK